MSKNSSLAYMSGQAARMEGRAFSSNPYKNPGLSTDFSVGWLDYKNRVKKLPRSLRLKHQARLRSLPKKR